MDPEDLVVVFMLLSGPLAKNDDAIMSDSKNGYADAYKT